jgi:hypothetical protein
MHAKDLVVNDSGNRKTVEAISERLPKLDVVSTFALVVETIDPVGASDLMVATEEKKVLRVLDLVCKQKADHLEGLLATVYIVT